MYRPASAILASLAIAAALVACGGPAPLDGGADASVDATSDARADASTDAPDGDALEARLAALQRACMLYEVCPLLVDPATTSGLVGTNECIAELQAFSLIAAPRETARLDRILTCGATSADCRAFERCVAADHGPAYCLAHPGRSCDGDVMVHCGDVGHAGYADVTDCSRLGLACRENHGSASCTLGATCTDPGGYSCAGNVLMHCDPDSLLATPVDCTQLLPGYTCQHITGIADITDGDYCAPSGGFCAVRTLDCDGTDLAACRDERDHVIRAGLRLTCAALYPQGRCELVGGTARCMPTLSACALDACDGPIARTCFAGVPLPLDCRTLGLPRCSLVGGSAFCTN